LLLYGADGVVDQVMMVVEDNYDKKKAEEEATLFLDAPAELEDEMNIGVTSYRFTNGRAYIG